MFPHLSLCAAAGAGLRHSHAPARGPMILPLPDSVPNPRLLIGVGPLSAGSMMKRQNQGELGFPSSAGFARSMYQSPRCAPQKCPNAPLVAWSFH